MNEMIVLGGCRPSPLLDYLKGLGTVRIVAEQLDRDVRCAWSGEDHLVLEGGIVDRDELLSFLMKDYQPSALLNPWGAKSGIYEAEGRAYDDLNKLVESEEERFKRYRYNASTIRQTLVDIGLDGKPDSDEDKARLMMALRGRLTDESLDWLDACLVLRGAREGGQKAYDFMRLYGTGGNEGNTSYTWQFRRALIEVLIDEEPERSEELLIKALFDEGSPKLQNLNAGQFHPGPIAEVNATEGFLMKKKTLNPWDLVLAMEGGVMFAGAPSRRLSNNPFAVPSFPFYVQPTRAGSHHVSKRDENSFEGEFWMPLWRNMTTYRELKHLFHEGRVQVGRTYARTGLEFARAVATLGTDRGIGSFIRYGRLCRQGSGKNANALAVPLDTMEVKMLPRVRLMDEIDHWLHNLRRACRNETTAQRYSSHLRHVEDAIYKYCSFGGVRRLQAVLSALGRAEAAIASAGANRPLDPLQNLSPNWIRACDDGSVEFRLACAMASIHDGTVGPIRAHLEPVEWDPKSKRLGRGWRDGRSSVAWGTRSLENNLAEVLKRRLMEGARASLDYAPIGGRINANLSDVGHFLEGRTDDGRMEDLLWGLSTIRWHQFDHRVHALESPVQERVPQLSRAYAMLKLVNLPGKLTEPRGGTEDGARWGLSYEADQGYTIPPMVEVLNMVDARRFEDALERAGRRLQASGLILKGSRRGRGDVPDFLIPETVSKRLAGALLIPVWEVDSLCKAVLRTDIDDEQTEQ